MKKIATLIFALSPFIFSSCKKLEERSDMTLYVTKIGNTAYSPTNQPGTIQCQTGEEFDVEYYFESKVPIDSYIYGTDYEKDQSQYLTGKPEEGALSGTIKFHFVVNDLIPEVFVNITNSESLGMELLNEEGVVVSKSFTLQRAN